MRRRLLTRGLQEIFSFEYILEIGRKGSLEMELSASAGVSKLDLACMQKLAAQVEAAQRLAGAIGRIANYRMADGLEMDPDLMSASGL